MASIKVKLRRSTVKGKPGSIYYCVSHKKIVRHITTKIHLQPGEWNEELRLVDENVVDSSSIQNRIDSDFTMLSHIVRELEILKGDFSTDEIITRFNHPNLHVSVTDFIEQQIVFLTECKKFGSALNYKRCLSSLKTYLKGRNLMFSEFTSGFIDEYNDFLLKKGLVRNSISFYMRILRAVYNKAVRRGYVEPSSPFIGVYTGVDKTRKRALKEDVINKLVGLDLSHKPALSFARDIFLFSLYTRGMAFVDIAFLKRTDIVDGNIRYSRQKSGQELLIRIEPCIKTIIEKYSSETRVTSYLFPILTKGNSEDNYKRYKSQLRTYNNRLKQLSTLMNLDFNLSSYMARHTWASIARKQNIPISIISAGMGHTSEKTTEIYLSSLENTLIDEANKKLLDSFHPLALNKKGNFQKEGEMFL